MRASLLLVPLLSMGAIGWTVCLDPGHGGNDPGAGGIYCLEKDANLEVAILARAFLETVPECEWVGMTRTADITVSLANRVAYANQNGFDRFVSIHENAFDTQTQGTETYCEVPSPGTQGYDLALKVLEGILWAHGYPNRGVKDGSWLYVIEHTNMTAILGEGSFIDYEADWNESYRYFTNWNDHKGRQAWAFAQGICLHLGSTPPPYSPQGFVVDNLSPGFSVNLNSQWNTGSYGDPWGSDYRWSTTSNASDWARWTPDLPQEGWHDVLVWFTEGDNRAPDALYIVKHLNGETSFPVDQTRDGGQWNLLGTFEFAAGTGGWVTLSEEGTTPGRVVIADAVRFEPCPAGVGDEGSTPFQQAQALAVAPNPGRAFTVTVGLQDLRPFTISVHDMTGRLVQTLGSGEGSYGSCVFEWNPCGLPSGVYMVSVTAGSEISAQRVVLLP